MFKKSKQLHILRSLTALVLALMIVMSAAPVAYADDSGTCGDSVKWSLSNGHLMISGKGAMTNFTEGNPAPWLYSADTITKVTVEAGVTRIGALSFYGCHKLTAVTLPEGLLRIGDRAFKDCTALPTMVFPSTLTVIGEAAFENCESLYGIRLPEGLRIIRDYAFYRCIGLTSITVPASVTSFGMVVFAYCKNLSQATILCPMEKVPDWTFYGCEMLSNVTLPESASSSGEYAFHDCDKLTTIHYTGESAKDLMDDIRQDESSIPNDSVITTAPSSGSGSSSDFFYDETENLGKSDSTVVTETENSIITKVESTESKFLIDGEEATPEQIESAGDDVDVDVESTTTTVITGTITKPEGWDELNEEINDELQNIDTKKDDLNVIVRVPEAKVEGDDLANLAGKDVTVSLITPDNDVWELNGKNITEQAVSGNKYDFGMTVTEMKAGKTKIDAEFVYKVEFARNVNFPVTVGVKVGHPYQIATLYEKKSGSYNEMGTVVVDKDGIAWCIFREISKKTDYYIGINVFGKTSQDAVIPKTLYSEYGLNDSLATLMDAEGNLYEITGNKSVWGITAKQFGIYAAVAVGAAVVIVTVVMFVINKFNRNKNKYRTMALADAEADDDYDDDEWEPLDEEALRLEIMRELLGEMDNSK